MDEKQKVIRTALIVLIVIVLAAAAYYMFFAERSKGAGAGADREAAGKAGAAEAVSPPGEAAPAVAVELDKSDTVLRPMAAELSSHPVFARWLQGPDLVRRFVAAVDNIANGQSPRPQIDFFSPRGDFKIVVKGGRAVIDPASFDRYNLVADVLDSLSTAGCVRLYESFRAPIRQAYRDLGYPNADFHQTLLRALIEILRTPIVEEPIAVEKEVTTFVMTDPVLEGLSPAQKHLLRMGPENLQLIQVKLREIGLALGFEEAQLPKARVYKPQL